MLFFAPWKKALIGFVCLMGLLASLPNLYYEPVQAYNDAKAIQLDPVLGEVRGPRASAISRALAQYFAEEPGAPSRSEVQAALRAEGGNIDNHWAALDQFFASDPKAPGEDDPRALDAYRALLALRELSAARENWPSFLPSGLVNLGLDLQGGAHFLLEAQLEEIHQARMESLTERLGSTLREAGVRRYSRPKLVGDDQVTIRITNAEDVEAAQAALQSLAQPVAENFLGGFATNAVDLLVTAEEDQTFRLTLTDEAKQDVDQRTMAQAIEVVRRRVDELGTREPTIQRQGVDRILVQLPGYSGTIPTDTAKLTFQMVAEDVSLADIEANRVPRTVEVLPFREEGRGSIALFKKVDLTGEQLADARSGFDGQTGEPVVNLRFDTAGARIFGDITRRFLGQRFAMVLDGEVLVAPVIRAYIPDGSSQISGGFSVEEASLLSVNLRAGALPVSLTVEESSVVGPELGADSIAAGKSAGMIGFALVLVYMAASYGMFGMFANLALMLNVTMIFGALSTLGATLTLPGIAGIVLTIGMAVDANVLIFERIREELRRGRNVARAVETGYEKALSAIIDANVTTFLAAAILFAMGSGPVKGFAVTLGIGIVTSVFTAVMLTRFFVASWFGYARPKELAL
ncbi:MAG: protein translocase subunit SecD [Rhodobacteraceae bacterium]|nr:protein translocase subunit SecD [Paracoccaceae bacterium]